MGLLKLAAPCVGALTILLNAAVIVSPDAFFAAFDAADVAKAVKTPLTSHMLFLIATTRIAIGALGVASVALGSRARAFIGMALAATYGANAYAEVFSPPEASPFKPSDPGFVVSAAFAGVMTVSLFLHMMEPGLFTADKGKKTKGS